METHKPEATEDCQLLLLLQQGDRSAFKLLYRKYWQEGYANAYKRLGNEDQAKDIVQEIFLCIWQNRHKPIVNLRAYIGVSVRNQVFKAIAKGKHSTPLLEVYDNVPSQHSEADARLGYREFCCAYERVLKTLPPKRQQIFRMRFNEDVPTKVIAEHMQISRKTVQNQLGKAIEQLRVLFLP